MIRKFIYFSILIVISIFSCESNHNKNEALSFDNETYNFDSAKKGTLIKGIFKFKNNSSKTITIENVSVECDCVSLNKSLPKRIEPGSIDSISINFNTTGVVEGVQEKHVTLRSNGIPRFYFLTLKGTIL